MIKLGAHAFVWVGAWTDETGDEAIVQAARNGFDFIEIPLLKPSTFDAKRHKATLKSAGIEATCSLTLPKNAHMPSAPKEAIAFLKQTMDKMEELGSIYLAGCIGYSLGTLTGAAPTAEERATVRDALAEVADDAATRGITLALEVCNRYETYMYNSLADARDTIKEIGAPNLKLHADTYHMNIEEEGFSKPLVEAADVLDYVHMSESHRGLVGTGTVDWADVWDGLARAGFQGRLALESFAAVNPDLAAATCLWRPTNYPPATLASEGLRFLREGAAKAGLQLG